MPNGSLESNELFKYVIQNKIDFIINLECKFQSFLEIASLSFKDTVLDNFNIKELKRKQTSFKFKVIKN